MPILLQKEKLMKLSNLLKMAYSRDLDDMDCHGNSSVHWKFENSQHGCMTNLKRPEAVENTFLNP